MNQKTTGDLSTFLNNYLLRQCNDRDMCLTVQAPQVVMTTCLGILRDHGVQRQVPPAQYWIIDDDNRIYNPSTHTCVTIVGSEILLSACSDSAMQKFSWTNN
jgi:hypothetical protein